MNIPALMQRLRNQTVRRLSALGGLACLMVLATYFMATRYSGFPGGDSYTYIRFARLMSRGQIAITGPLRDLIDAHIDSSAWVTPIWNTVILPDGRWVFSVAPGYPLVLALIFRVFGEWAMMHANMALQLLMLLVFFGLVVGTLQSRPWATTAAMVGLVLLLSLNTRTQQQFVHLWREPLIFLLLLLAAGSYLLMDRYTRLFWLIPLFLGYACAVKESSILYAGWMGLSVLMHPAFRARAHKGRAIVFGSLLFLVGCAPLLLQNWSYTGRPWVSLYVVRETSEFSVGDIGAGLSMGNLGIIPQRYLALYKPYAVQALLLLMIGGWGAWQHRRHPLTMLMGGWLCLHVGLCMQWGNAEYRHMYFAYLPVVYFFVLGVHDLISRIDRADRVPVRQGIVYALLLFALLPAVRNRQPPQAPLKARDWQAFVKQATLHIDPGSLLFVNRPMRDVIGGYSDLDVIEMQGFLYATQRDPVLQMRAIVEGDVPIYFMDANDMSPRSRARTINMTLLDWTAVLYSADPVPVGQLDMETYRMDKMVEQERVTLYRLQPWRQAYIEKQVEIDPPHTAFLSLSPRGLNDDLHLTINDEPVAHDFSMGTFIPVKDAPPSLKIVATREGGALMPADLDIDPINWHGPLFFPVGLYAIPDDGVLFENIDLSHEEPLARGFEKSVQMRLPIREGPDLFSVVQVSLDERESERRAVTVYGDDNESNVVSIHDRNIWIQVPRRTTATRRAGYQHVRMGLGADDVMMLSRLAVRSAWTEWTPATLAPDYLGVIIGGYLVPEQAGDREWRYAEDGHVIMAGEMTSPSNPRDNPFAAYVRPSEEGHMPSLQWLGAGVMDLLEVPLTQRFHLSPDAPLAPILVRGTYAAELDETGGFRWTGPGTYMRLPVGDSSSAYRLTLDLAYRGIGGGDGRPVGLIVGDNRHDIVVDNEVRRFELEWAALKPDNGWITVVLDAPLWSPAEYGSGDTRQLGIRWYGSTWELLSD